MRAALPTEVCDERVARLEARGHRPVPAFNPYWDRWGGRTFADPDGYRVVLQNAPRPGSDST
jgi:hypothetical protein